MSEKNGKDDSPPQPPQPQIDLDEVNGRILELSEVNAALQARCGSLRAQVLKKDKELDQLRLKVAQLEGELAARPKLPGATQEEKGARKDN